MSKNLNNINEEDKKKRKKFGFIFFGTLAATAAIATAIAVPIALRDKEQMKELRTSYKYDLTSTTLSNLNNLYEMDGQPGVYTDDVTHAKGFSKGTPPRTPELQINGMHFGLDFLISGDAFDNSKWIMNKVPGHAASASAKDYILAAPYGVNDESKFAKYILGTAGNSYDASKWEITKTTVHPSIAGERPGAKYFLGYPLAAKFDSKSFEQLTPADKKEIVLMALSKGAISFNPSGSTDPNATPIKWSINPALTDSTNPASSAFLGLAGGKHIPFRSGTVTVGTPTRVESVAQINSQKTTYPQTVLHDTLIGMRRREFTNDDEYRDLFYESIFESTISALKHYDRWMNIDGQPDFSLLAFGYEGGFVKFTYKYDGTHINVFDKKYLPVVNTWPSGRKNIPLFKYEIGNRPSPAVNDKYEVSYGDATTKTRISALDFSLPFRSTNVPTTPPSFDINTYDDGSKVEDTHPNKAVINIYNLKSDSILKVYVGGTLSTIPTIKS